MTPAPRSPSRRLGSLGLGLLIGTGVAALPALGEVSYHREIAPLFADHCRGCHHPGKRKGDLDLSTPAALMQGGKHGVAIVPGRSAESPLMGRIRGPEADMPKNADLLPAEACARVAQWIDEGAKDDSPPASPEPAGPPVYAAPPGITALAYAPDGRTLAVSGHREVFIVDVQDYRVKARWGGRGTRVEALEYSPDGRRLAVAAGTPGVLGEIQVWDVARGRLERAHRVAWDSVFGVHWSPDGTRVAFGGADKTVRVLRVDDGRELVRFDQHGDWVFGAVFVNNGTQVVSGSRDRSLKLIDANTGALLEILNRDTEPVQCLARHPREDWVVFGSEVRPRLYRAALKADHNDPNADPNAIREFEHFDQGVTAVAFSGDGQWLATAGGPTGEVRVHAVATGARKSRLVGAARWIHALGFSPDGTRLATAGQEGIVRIHAWSQDRQEAAFAPSALVTSDQPPPGIGP